MLSEGTLPLCATPLPTAMRMDIVEGREAILPLSGMLVRFAQRCKQVGAMQDLAYFLSKPGLMRRTPQLMLIFGAEGPCRLESADQDLLGAVLLFDYRVVGCSLGMYTTNDRSGRNTLVGPAHLRSALAEFAGHTLIERGAHVVMISFRDGDATTRRVMEKPAKTRGFPWKANAWMTPRWARRERVIPEYLSLESTFDGTLALIGQTTRRNMRYYRRRAEKDLGCVFHSAVEIGRAEFLAFNRECTFAVPDRVAEWRYDIHRQLEAPLLAGIQDKDGRWLSIVGARRFNTSSEILWQMNRNGLPNYSLSLVMRTYLIEHEISQGSRRFYMEGGSAHAIRHSFVSEQIVDFAILRRSPTAVLTRRLARHVVPGDNQLAHMLSDPELVWTPARRSERGSRHVR